MSERNLDMGQTFDDYVYLKSKMAAEKLVYRARRKGLNASVYRIGNLVGRDSDGLFQQNIATNYLYNHIKALVLLKQCPAIIHEMTVEMAPIDLCSAAMVKLVLLKDAHGYNFHLLNPNMLNYRTLTGYLNRLGHVIETVSGQAFHRSILEIVESDRFKTEIEINRIFYILMHYGSDEGGKGENPPGNETNVQPIEASARENQGAMESLDSDIDSSFTVEVLKKAGFSWNQLDFPFISKIIGHCNDVGYITRDD